MPQPQKNEQVRECIGQRRERQLSGVEFRAVEGQDRTFELSFSSEEPVNRWWGTEILSHDPNAPNLGRLNDGGVLLYGHQTDIGSVLGPVSKAWLDETTRKCRCVVTFDNDDDAERVFRKVESGTLRNVSFAYSLDAIEEVKAGATSSNGRFAGPCEVITQWTAYEVSIVPVPADASVGIGRSIEEAPTPPSDGGENTAETREVTMPKTVTPAPEAGEQPAVRAGAEAMNPPSGSSNVQPAGQTEDQIRAAAIETERKRSSEITTLCRELGIDDTKRDEWIGGGNTVDQVNRAALDILKERNKPSATVRVGDGPQDHFRAAAPHALLLRQFRPDQLRAAGIEKPHELAEKYRSMGLQALLRECARLNGRADATTASIDELMHARDMFTPDSAFTSIVDNTVGHSMMIGHRGADTTFQEWVRVGSNPNFKSTPKYRLSEAGEPQKITQSGEFTKDELTDQGVNTKVDSYGITWNLTRQAIINDDLGVITEMPARYAMGAMRKINRDVYAILNSNPTVFDGKTLFVSDHGNLATTGAAPTVNSLSLGRAAMRKQTGLRSLQALNISPKYLIVGVDIETVSQQLVGATADPAASHVAVPNPFQTLTVLADAMITDTNSWHLAASPDLFDTIEVTTLNGKLAPTIESRVGFDILGMEWRLYIDYGVTVLDYRGLYKNAGAS